MTTRLRHRVGQAIRDHAMWEAGDPVAVAVSGGLDSVALLDLLAATKRWHGAQLEVVTIDHGLRADSALDAEFVQHVAAGAGLPCTTIRVQVAAPAGEAEMRAARYAALEGVAVRRVALAHHRDDLAETMLLQLLRGSGTAGLAGMRPVRGRYVRPLLGIGKDEVRAWAAARGLVWREDPTNADPRFARNRIRNEVLPLLESVRAGATRALARSAEIVAKDDAWLESFVVSGPPWTVAFVRDAPEPVVRRSLARGVPGIGASAIDAVIVAARRGRGRVLVAGGAVRVHAGEVVFAARAEGRDAPGPDVTCSST